MWTADLINHFESQNNKTFNVKTHQVISILKYLEKILRMNVLFYLMTHSAAYII
jgi:hypothetical protein